MAGDPLAGEKGLKQRTGEVPGSPEVHVLRSGILTEAGHLEPPLGSSVFLGGDLAVDQKAQSFFEGEIGHQGRIRLLFIQGLEEAGELEGLQLVLERVDQHGHSPCSKGAGRRAFPPSAV